MVYEVPQSRRKTPLWSELIKQYPKWSNKARKLTFIRLLLPQEYRLPTSKNMIQLNSALTSWGASNLPSKDWYNSWVQKQIPRQLSLQPLRNVLKSRKSKLEGCVNTLRSCREWRAQVPDLKQQVESLKSEKLKLRVHLNECLAQSEVQLAATPSFDFKVISLDKNRTD